MGVPQPSGGGPPRETRPCRLDTSSCYESNLNIDKPQAVGT